MPKLKIEPFVGVLSRLIVEAVKVVELRKAKNIEDYDDDFCL